MANDLTPDTRNQTPDTHDERLRLVRQVVDNCLVQRATGESLSDAVVMARHPELMPQLGHELERARLIAGARARVDASDALAAERADRSGEFRDSLSGSNIQHPAPSSVRLQCPHCQAMVAIQTVDSWSTIRCSACGSGFSLIDDDEHDTGVQPGSTIGRFVLLERLGSGGFGVVWKAHDPQLDRVVALKVPRRGELTSAETELFFREARAAAQVRHPNIVSIHEVGRDGDTVFLVSDFVNGEPLVRLLNRRRLTVREAAALCEQTARALAHIHEAGIVHRDLKPANVIVTSDADGELQPHLTDFGLARRVTGELTMTADGQLMGTPAYMSPEQASGGGHTAGPASDVYSLGVILFELLAGEPPFRGAPTMVIDQVLNDEPVSPRRLNALVPRDLETITLKCLEKEPAKRYETAAAVADDLGRWQRGEPIVARPLGRFARAYRWGRRHPAATVVALVLMLGGPTIGLVMTGLAWSEATARRAAVSAREQTRQVLYASSISNVQAAVEHGDTLRAERLLLNNRPAAGEEDLRSFEWYYWWRQAHAGLAATIRLPEPSKVTRIDLDDPRLAGAFSPPSSGVARSLKAISLSLALTRESLVSLVEQESAISAQSAHNGQMIDAALSADESLLATCGGDRTVQIWDANTGAQRATLRGEPKCSFVCVDVSPQGTLVTATSSVQAVLKNGNNGWKTEVYVWNSTSGEVIRHWEAFDAHGKHVTISPDGNLIAVGGSNTPVLFNVETGEKRVLASPGVAVLGSDFSPDGRQLAGMIPNGNEIYLWDLDTGAISKKLSPHPNGYIVKFCQNSNQLISVGLHGTLKLWNISHDSSPRRFTEENAVVHLAFGADGRRLVANSQRQASVWDVSTGQRVHVLDALGPGVHRVSLSVDGSAIAAPRGHDLLLYSADSGQLLHTCRGHAHPVRKCQIAPSGALVASGDGNVTYDPRQPRADAILWDAKSGRLLHRLPEHYQRVQVLAFSPDERTLVTVDGHNSLRTWDVATGKLLRTSGEMGREWVGSELTGLFHLVFDRDGESLYDCAGQTMHVVDATNGTLRRKLAFGALSIGDFCLSPDGKTLAVARGMFLTRLPSAEGVVELWDVASGELKTTLAREFGESMAVAFSPDGRTLATGHRDGTIALWQAATEEEVRRQAPP